MSNNQTAAETVHEFILPSGRKARYVENPATGAVEVVFDEDSAAQEENKGTATRSLVALVLILVGAAAMSVGVGGLFGVWAAVLTAGTVALAIGVLLAMT